MRHRRISVTLILMFLCTMFLSSALPIVSSQDSTIDITIAYTHDLHSHLYSEWTGSECSGGMPLISTKVQELRANRPTLLFDCGDTLSGAPVNDFNGGVPMVEVMNEIGYDAMAMDNHEYDQGLGVLKDMITAADFDVLSANAHWSGLPQPRDYSIETIAGYEIGVIGLSPIFWYAPPQVTITDQADAANAAVVTLQDLGVDFIVLLGCFNTYLADNVFGVDILMNAGPSVQTINNILVVPKIGVHTSQLGVLDLTIDTDVGIIDSYSFSVEYMDAPIVPDEDIVDMIDTWNIPYANLDLAIGYFDTYQGIPDLGILMTDAFVQETAADIGVTFHGSVRESIAEGFVTNRDIYRVEPFFNTLATIELLGSDIQTIISSAYYTTTVSSFEPTTWYTIASANFTITSFENIYTSNNRQDYPSTDVVDLFADYISTNYPVESQDLLSVIDECSNSASLVPDSYLIGGTPFDIKLQITQELLDARNALVDGNDYLAYDPLISAINLVEAHVNVSCPERWLVININNVIAFLDLQTTTTSTNGTVVITTGPVPTAGPAFPWFPILAIAIVIPIVLIAIVKLRMR